MDTKNITIRIRDIRQADEITLLELIDLLGVEYAVSNSPAPQGVRA